MHEIADRAPREDGLLLLELRRRVVAAFHVGSTEPGKLDCLTASRQDRHFALSRCGGDLQRRSQHARIQHL